MGKLERKTVMRFIRNFTWIAATVLLAIICLEIIYIASVL